MLLLVDFIIRMQFTCLVHIRSRVLGVFKVIIKYKKREKGGNGKGRKKPVLPAITPCSRSFPLFSTEAQECAMQNLEKACARGSQVTTRRVLLTFLYSMPFFIGYSL